MDENQPTAEPQLEPISFSLGTVFLTISCIGVALAAFRIPADGGLRVAFGVVFVAGFLMLWYLATRQFRRLRLPLWLMAVGLALLFLAGFPRAQSGDPSPRAECANNLRQIGLALLGYHRTYGSFPPAYVADAKGKPLYSWRVLILPELDHANLAKMIRSDERWDGPNNTKATGRSVIDFVCPDDPQSASLQAALTSYVAVVGPHTAWAGAKPRKLSDLKDPSKTILLVEIAKSGIHWAEPRDLYIGQMAPGINPKVGQGISSDHPDGGANVLFADGSVRFLPNATDPKKLAEMLDLDGCNDRAAIDGDSQ